MPHLFRISSYVVFFWSNEGKPLEPIHVHISYKRPIDNSTKIWITESGKCLLSNNNSKIPSKTLKQIISILENQNEYIKEEWLKRFGSINYYC